jgi:PAS domain S-box-containing protein
MGPSAEAKLALVEFLIGSEEPAECIQQSLEWLGEHAGLRQVAALEIDRETARLVVTAGYGLPSARVDQFSVDLETRDHPLIAALAQIRPAFIAPEVSLRVRQALPFRGPLVAIPFQGLAGGERVMGGLLVGSPGTPAVARDLQWVAEVLGHRLIRMRWQKRLARERSLLYGIVNAVVDPVMLTDSEGRLVIANSRAESLFASRPEQSEGRRRAVALNNMLFSAALGERAIKDAAPERRELLLVDPVEGSDLLFELLSTHAGDSREGTGIVSVLRNVTDLRRATEEIEANYGRLRIAEAGVRAERDRLDLIIDSVADPIVVTDATGNIVMMNAPADRFFTEAKGADAEDALRVRANDANFTSFVSNVFLGVSELRYRGGVNLVDPRTGAGVPLEAVCGKIFSEQGELTAVVTILHDRTEALERERLYDQLKQASGELERKVREATAELVRQNELLRRQAIQLEQASALKSQFLANMSHEFRTPLNAILGYTSMLLKGVLGPVEGEQAEGLARVDSNARHLLGIINDILDISRIEAGRMPLRVGEFRLPELVGEVLAEVEPIVAQSTVHIEAAIDRRLPALRSDRQKVKQIILNLLINAIKFTPRGSITVTAAYDARARKLAIAVADTGLGIAPEDQARIFQDFQQADSSTTRTHGGAGLGLSICKRLAGMLNGEIRLQSKPGAGSTFTLVLPRRGPRR